MNSERFRQIETLYHAAREATADERAALLARADPELRHEVELLLSEQNGAEFLDRPAIEHASDLLEDAAATVHWKRARVLGPYRIEHKLGEGGMGEVFRAVDTRLGRAVAIKITQEQFSARFEREARAIASLNHPNICTLYDVGPNYLVMELVEGETLAARLKRGPLPMNTALLYASADCGRTGRGACQGHRSPRSQTGQHHDREIRHQGAGFRAGEIGPGSNGHRQPHGDGHARLHGAGTTGGQARRRPHGYLRIRLCPLRNVGGRAVGASAEAPLVTEARTNCQPVPRRGPWTTVAIRCRVATGAGGDHAGETRDSRGDRCRRDSGRYPLRARTSICTRPRNSPAQDTIVLAEFTNTTGDPVFDETMRQGLAVQLQQSPFLSLVSDERIRRTLPLMNVPRGCAIDSGDCARACASGPAAPPFWKDRSRALGSQYVLGLRAKNCTTGDILADEQAQARTQRRGSEHAQSDCDALSNASRRIARHHRKALDAARGSDDSVA